MNVPAPIKGLWPYRSKKEPITGARPSEMKALRLPIQAIVLLNCQLYVTYT
jgi:hypothetical protein